MTHPEELLAGYVDGTLSTQDRAVVDGHLTACERCRREVADARVAVAALARLPEIPAPLGLGSRAVQGAEPAAADARGASGIPRWQRWVVPAAAAAAVLLVATLVLPKIGGGGSPSADQARRPGAAVATGGSSASVPLEISSEDYGPDALASLAADSVAKLTAGAAEQPEASTSGGTPVRTAAPAASAKATACIQQAFKEVPGTPVRLIRARFQGQPAYIGFYAESPGSGQPLDALTVRVAAVQGCTLLHITQVAA